MTHIKDRIRAVDQKRGIIFTLKLSQEEADGLRDLASKHCRRPGDELRWLLTEALRPADSGDRR